MQRISERICADWHWLEGNAAVPVSRRRGAGHPQPYALRACQRQAVTGVSEAEILPHDEAYKTVTKCQVRLTHAL